MASDFDRDNSVDRLLKGARRDLTPPEEAGPACLDAETLAAWADGGLDAGAVRLVEAHVADCPRCQAMSAAFFAADDGAAASSRAMPFRTNRVMYWLPIAVGTIAATLVIWMGVRGRTLPEATGAMGDALIKETATPAPTGGFGQPGTVARQEPAPPAASPLVPAKPADSKARVDLRAERATQDAPTTTKSRANAQQQGQQGVRSAPAVGAAAAPPPPAQIAQPVTRATPPPPTVVTATPTPTSTPVQTQTAVTSAAGQSASARESVMFRSTAAAQVIAEFASVDPRASTINGLPGVVGGVAGGGAGAGASGGRGGGGGGGRGGARAADVVSTLPMHWRILASDVLEKSTDRITWETITIAPPVQGLLHGSAPSPAVCWIVGRAGLVLLTTDGRQFTRVTSPTTADLASIKAIDARQATVTTTDGRTFTTDDGGKSWK